MSGGARLQIALRRAVSTLRQLADSLESALEEESHEERSRSTSGSTSRAPDWDLLSGPPAPTAAVQPSPGLDSARTSPNAGYDEVARLLTKAPQHCFDLCNRLSGTSEFVKFRVQRAWEAGLWARAVVEGKIPKPRPTRRSRFGPPHTLWYVVLVFGILSGCHQRLLISILPVGPKIHRGFTVPRIPICGRGISILPGPWY